jgi:hypothetical protein
MTDFQSLAGRQGRQFSEQCDLVLESEGFTREGRLLLPDLGIEIDCVARTRGDRLVWFEFKGSFRGSTPGMRRTDTVKKAIANGALLAALPEHPPYVVLTSHLPERGAARAMLDAALELRYVADVICVNDPAAVRRLRAL